MWSLFSRRRDLDNELYASLRPGDLYGAEREGGRQWQHLLRYLLLANASALTFFAILLSRVSAEAPAHKEIGTAVWLTGLGLVIAAAAWSLIALSRKEESKAIAQSGGKREASELPPSVGPIMKKAAIKKLLAFRVMIVSAISFCVAIYLGLKGLYLL